MNDTGLTTMMIYVIEQSRDAKKHFAWATSLEKAHRHGRTIFPSGKYSTRAPTPQEWEQINFYFSCQEEWRLNIQVAR